MKKIFLMSGLFILSGCADTALLGYDKTYYNPVPEGDVAVYYDYIPQNCQQIGMTILTISPWSGSLQKEIRELREEAAKIGGNCVNIRNYSYSAGLAKASAYHMTGTIYRCQNSNSK